VRMRNAEGAPHFSTVSGFTSIFILHVMWGVLRAGANIVM
jgi:hypothetical protein